MKTIPNQKSMTKSVAYLSHYMGTYDKQPMFEEYRPETYIDDVLYGLGVSLSDEFKFGGGFDNFKDFLRDYLAK